MILPDSKIQNLAHPNQRTSQGHERAICSARAGWVANRYVAAAQTQGLRSFPAILHRLLRGKLKGFALFSSVGPRNRSLRLM